MQRRINTLTATALERKSEKGSEREISVHIIILLLFSTFVSYFMINSYIINLFNVQLIRCACTHSVAFIIFIKYNINVLASRLYLPYHKCAFEGKLP